MAENNDLQQKLSDAADTVKEKAQEVANEVSEKAPEVAAQASAEAKTAVNDVVSEGKEVYEEAKAAVTGQTLNPQNTGDAGYRAPEQPGAPKSNLAVISLVLGIISIVLAFCGIYVSWLGVVLGIIGIVLGAKARKESQTGLATAGFVCSIIGLVLSALMLLCAACALVGLAAVGASLS